MQRYTLRAVRQSDGRYRVAIDPTHPDVSSDRRYTRDEVEQLATRLEAELRWVEPPSRTRRAPDPTGPLEPRSLDPWGGALPPGEESHH